VPGEGNRTPLSAWELYGAARLPPGDSATCGDIGDLTVSDRDYPQALLLSGTQRARRPLRPELAAPWSSSPPSELRITRVFPCVARRFKACASFMFAGCCSWRWLAVDGGSGTSRGHRPVMRRPGSQWSGAVSRPSAFRPDISQVATDRASVVRCRWSLPLAVGCYCCCQLGAGRPVESRPAPCRGWPASGPGRLRPALVF
jgi:hypothetical protein